MKSTISSRYDPAKYPNLGNFLLSIYSKLFDCNLNTNIIYSKILHAGVRNGADSFCAKITKEHCSSFDLFSALMSELNDAYSLYSQQSPSKQTWVRKYPPKDPAANMLIEDQAPESLFIEEIFDDDDEEMPGNEYWR